MFLRVKQVGNTSFLFRPAHSKLFISPSHPTLGLVERTSPEPTPTPLLLEGSVGSWLVQQIRMLIIVWWKLLGSRALHFGHKSGDGNYLSLLTDHGAYLDQNFVLGQEFETFSNKGPVIESGLNTLNSLMTLHLNFNVGHNYLDQNFVLGQEFETFSNKGPVIESGLNTLNSF